MKLKIYPMKKLFTILFLLYSTRSFCQTDKWKYSKGSSDFDGEYRTATIVGTGGEFPYANPLFVVNRFNNDLTPNVYITKAGYAGCANTVAYFKFNNDDTVYLMEVTTNNESDVWFIKYASYEDEPLYVSDLIKKMSEASYMSVRLRSDCGQTDYRFSLNGSTKALKFVVPSYFNN